MDARCSDTPQRIVGRVKSRAAREQRLNQERIIPNPALSACIASAVAHVRSVVQLKGAMANGLPSRSRVTMQKSSEMNLQAGAQADARTHQIRVGDRRL